MSCKLVITNAANADLDEIIIYICTELANPVAAVNLLSDIENCYSLLELSPKMYALCDNERLKSKSYRKAVINDYVMLYRYDESNQTVYILRFFYGRRDYINLI